MLFLHIDAVKMKIADLSLLNEANTVSHLIDALRKRYAGIYLHFWYATLF